MRRRAETLLLGLGLVPVKELIDAQTETRKARAEIDRLKAVIKQCVEERDNEREMLKAEIERTARTWRQPTKQEETERSRRARRARNAMQTLWNEQRAGR